MAVAIPPAHQLIAQTEPLMSPSPTTTPNPEVAPSPPSNPSTADKIKFRKKTIRTMETELEQTLASVQSGSYSSANTTFNKALKKWYTFGGTIKRLSPTTYSPVADGFATVKTALQQSNASQKSLIANLQTLIRNAKEAVTVSDAND
ncbi:MAG TPA: hypothetical protein V6D19_11210 [Stenomitos sp.]